MKLSQILKHCLNLKVLIGIGGLIVLAYIFMPNFASFSWILVALVCPLSMIFMMKKMDHDHSKTNRIFVCPECKLSYKDAELAIKCAKWCGGNHSCNSEIAKHAIK